MDLTSAADELYGLPLSDFVTARTRLEKQARAAGDAGLASDVRAMRKPSQAAWAFNQVVRRSPELLDDVLRLADELRAAQEAGEAAVLRRLTTRRHELFAALRQRAEELVAQDGRRLAAAAVQALERTVGAAMADPRAAEVVRSGRLVVDLENAGWGPVDLDGAQAAAPDRKPEDRKPADREPEDRKSEDRKSAERAAERREAEQALAGAQDEAADAAAARDRAEDAVDAASTDQQRLAERKKSLLAELREIERDEESAAHELRSAREARARAVREVDRTARLAERARRRVDA